MYDSPLSKVLIIDDDPKTVRLIEAILTQAGLQVISALSGAQGLRKLYQDRPHLILLDVMMPELDGWQTYAYIRELSDLPVIFISSSNKTSDIALGLNLGAVDYISKPFETSVLLARTKAALRTAASISSFEPFTIYRDPRLTIDPTRQLIWLQDQAVALTARERQLLFFLYQQAGTLCTLEQILRHVWGWEYRESTQYVHVYISRLRQKLEIDPKQPRYILTEHGKGYWFKK